MLLWLPMLQVSNRPSDEDTLPNMSIRRGPSFGNGYKEDLISNWPASRWNYRLCDGLCFLPAVPSSTTHFGLTFALPPFFQQPVLCDFERHAGLRFDRCNRHLIRHWHRDEEEGAVDDVR